MKKLFTLISVMAVFTGCPTMYAQGLKFHGMDNRIEDRTSYTVFPERGEYFDKKLDISFEFRNMKGSDFGYILRIKDIPDGSRIWNLSYDSRDSEDVVIRLNEEGRYSLVKAIIPKQEMEEMRWTCISLDFDMTVDSVTVRIGDREYRSHISTLPGGRRYQIMFGRSEHMIDVPTCAIRNLNIAGDDKAYHFPFNETKGGVVHDSRYRIVGKVENPEWMIRESVEWQKLVSFKSPEAAGATYNPLKKEFYYFNSHEIYKYDIRKSLSSHHEFKTACPMEIKLGMCYMHNGNLVAYEAGAAPADSEKASAALLDLDKMAWTALGNSRLDTPVHHHCSFTDGTSGEYCIYGGFGDSRYNGRFFGHRDNRHWTEKWETPDSSGYRIAPRYFTSAGSDSTGRFTYIFGGMGNEAGEQVVGRRYFYDLHRIDTQSGECTKLWEIDWKDENVVPVRNSIINGDYLYTLCYPEYLSKSYLRLYRFSLKDGSYEILCDEIGINSDKVSTNANIYYDADLKMMFATTLVSEDDIQSELNIYSITYPPLSQEEFSLLSKEKNRRRRIFPFAAILLTVGAVTICMIFRNSRKESENYLLSKTNVHKKRFYSMTQANAIYTFGDLQIIDRHGNDIASTLSNQQKTLLLLLIKYEENGLSSKKLRTTFWPDKDEEKAKNSRGVTINKLRNKLADVDGLSIVFSDKSYRLILENGAYCDCFHLFKEMRNDLKDSESILRIISRGKFFCHIDDPLFDSFKDKVETMTYQFLESELKTRFENRKYMESIEIADMIFTIDPLSEMALAYKIKALNKINRREDALSCYSEFTSEYRKTTGEHYPLKFEKL